MINRAKITAPEGYKCAPNGWKVETIPFGTIVEGKIADWALADKAASALFDPRKEKKVTGPAETKAATKKRKK